jgi:hypothetical protein
VLASSGSYGLFVEVNPESTGERRAPLSVFCGEDAFPTTTPVIEEPGPWYCPLLGSLITAGGRLILGMIERAVTEAGGTYLLCDTDAMAIVAAEQRELVPCAGGPHRLSDGREAILALSWSEVDDRVVARFNDELNPYDRRAAPTILKIEAVNFGNDERRQPLFGYAIAAKRYAFFRPTGAGVRIEKASAHGLGFLFPPNKTLNKRLKVPEWIVEVWQWHIEQVLGHALRDPKWFDRPAMMRFVLTTPEVLQVLHRNQEGVSYREGVKPF